MDRTTISAVLRSTQAYCLQLCEKVTLEYGICYHSERFGALPDGSQFREVVIDEPANVGDAWSEAEGWFGEHDSRSLRWTPAEGQDPAVLESFLSGQGFRRVERVVLALTDWPEGERGAVRILPARALRAAYREVVDRSDEVERSPHKELLVSAYEQRLDDPSYDAFVAVVDGKPAGRCALYQVGDIGRVMSLAALKEFEGRGVEQVLLMHALKLARRLALPTVCAAVEAVDMTALALYEGMGFTQSGRITEFERDVRPGSAS